MVGVQHKTVALNEAKSIYMMLIPVYDPQMSFVLRFRVKLIMEFIIQIMGSLSELYFQSRVTSRDKLALTK